MGREVAERYFAALRTRDAGQVAALFHPDVIAWDPIAGATRGRNPLKLAFTHLFATMPDAHFEPTTWIVEGPRCAVEWRWTGTGPRGPLSIWGTDVMEFDMALISSIKFYYDPTPLLSPPA